MPSSSAACERSGLCCLCRFVSGFNFCEAACRRRISGFQKFVPRNNCRMIHKEYSGRELHAERLFEPEETITMME